VQAGAGAGEGSAAGVGGERPLGPGAGELEGLTLGQVEVHAWARPPRPASVLAGGHAARARSGEGDGYLWTGGIRRPLAGEVTTVGRGAGCDVRPDDASVAVLHAKLVSRDPYPYVGGLGPQGDPVTVNGRAVTRCLLADGAVIGFGQVNYTAGGITGAAPLRSGVTKPPHAAPGPRPRPAGLSPRQREVVAALREPAWSGQAFAAPESAPQISAALGITAECVEYHLARLYHELGVPAGPGRRVRLANPAVTAGLVQPPAGQAR
jgi:hypothetical protein